MTNSEARKRAQTARPCPACSGTVRETTDMVCQTCGTDYAASPELLRGVETFSRAWAVADALGWTGHRVEAGIRALIAAGWKPPPC